MSQQGFLALGLEDGVLYEHGNRLKVSASNPVSCLQLAAGHTHFGVVIGGTILLNTRHRKWSLSQDDYFSVKGPAIISGGRTVVISIKGYDGLNVCGGPIEERGRLRYIDGSTDTLLIHPVRKGDPCLNYLHFPPRSAQTHHTHPSIRINMVLRGEGFCVLPEEGRRVALVPGYVFVIPTDTVHAFETEDGILDVITFHPETDVGMTDDDHPMVNKTIVDGVSAAHIPAIRTQPPKRESSE